MLSLYMRTKGPLLAQGIETVSWEQKAPYRTVQGTNLLRVDSRGANGPYAFGRATLYIGDLLRLKYEVEEVTFGGFCFAEGLRFVESDLTTIELTDQLPGTISYMGEKSSGSLIAPAEVSLIIGHLMPRLADLYSNRFNELEVGM